MRSIQIIGRRPLRWRAAIAAATKPDDDGTSDLFTAILRDVDKYPRFLEAHLQAGH